MSDYNLVQFRKDLEQLPVILNQEQEEKFILYLHCRDWQNL